MLEIHDVLQDCCVDKDMVASRDLVVGTHQLAGGAEEAVCMLQGLLSIVIDCDRWCLLKRRLRSWRLRFWLACLPLLSTPSLLVTMSNYGPKPICGKCR